MERKTLELKNLIDLKETSIVRQQEMHFFYEENFRLFKSAGSHQRDTKAAKELSKLNKQPLLDMSLIIWAELEKARVFINKVVDYCKIETDVKTSHLVTGLEDSFTETKTSSFVAELDENLTEINKKLMTWGENIVTDMREVLKEQISGALPIVVEEAVTEISTNKKFTKSWSDLFKKSQDDIKAEANKAFRESLTTALTDSQHEIIENVQMKHDNDMFEKERRSRNIVIGKCPESTVEHPTDRLQCDLTFVKSVTGLSDNDLVKCIRAGPKEDRVTGVKATSRPIIVTLQSPDLAKQLHNLVMETGSLTVGKFGG